MIWFRTVALLALLASVVQVPLRAQGGALTPEARRLVVDSVASLVERHYVVPDTGRMIAEHVREQALAGAYQNVRTLPALAEVLSKDLKAVNRDGHLSVRFDPALASALSVASEKDPAEAARAEREMAERARRNNYGFERVEILEGNVGHLKLGGAISGSPEAFERAEQALRFLAETDAVILDLRRVPGGSGNMANFLISHFTGPDVPSLKIYWKPQDRTTIRRTLSEVPGPRRTDVPLYVLVDDRSASAAEDIPFVLQNLGRATIVGDTTVGAGRNNRYYPAGQGLAVSVSISRVQDPETGREWEQVGVIPDIPVASEEALAAAYLRALDRVIAQAQEDQKEPLALIREHVGAQYRPVPVPLFRLQAYTGTYEGDMEVTLADGGLQIRRRSDLPLDRLNALSDTRFSFGPTDRVVFTRDPGGGMWLEIRRGGRSVGEFARIN